jgi:hypothetical protein
MPRVENLADLRKIKESAASRIMVRGPEGARAVVKSETCGAAAEARDVMSSLN